VSHEHYRVRWVVGAETIFYSSNDAKIEPVARSRRLGSPAFTGWVAEYLLPPRASTATTGLSCDVVEAYLRHPTVLGTRADRPPRGARGRLSERDGAQAGRSPGLRSPTVPYGFPDSSVPPSVPTTLTGSGSHPAE
jgi:hypothetical protein